MSNRLLWNLLCAALAAVLMACGPAQAAPLVITQAQAVASPGERFPEGLPMQTVRLPDDWSQTRPRYDGSVWYRAAFDAPADTRRDDLLALYIERACTNVEVFLNGHRVYSGGRMAEPLTRNCYHPQLVTLPAALLHSQGNQLDLHLMGSALQRVAARQRAGGLSPLVIGPQSQLAASYNERLFWNVTLVEMTSLTLLIVGSFMLGLFWLNRREVPLLYFGTLLAGWALLSTRVWWRDLPMDTATVEFIACCAFPPLVACLVQFLLSYAALRSRLIEAMLIAQCVLMPLSLMLAGPSRLHTTANGWFAVLAVEVFAAIGLYLTVVWKHRRPDFAPMLMILGGTAGLMLYAIAVQLQAVQQPPVQLMHFAVPVLFLGIGS
ncbi:MAG TPA: histidine kinase, partial [Albitalea sp.]|nr:histidine kinase [Albitalea sp.]